MNVQTILRVKGFDVATIDQHSTLTEAVTRLRDHGVGALVVSGDGKRIDGIVSERDIVRGLAEHGPSSLDRPVSSVMSTDVVTCACDDSVEKMMATMTERRIRHLPVLGDDGMLAGIVSIGDVVKARLGELETDNQALVEYLHQGL